MKRLKTINFDSTANLVKKQLNSFSSFIKLQKIKEIASPTLDIDKVNEFKQKLYDKWHKSKLIRKILEHFKI